LYYFLVGLSLTNHPIALFLLPAFVIFPIYIDWKEVFKIKKIFIIILLIVSPNLLYLYLPIRSFQGYGNITTFYKFIDYISGLSWKKDFGFTSWANIKKILEAYSGYLKGDFSIFIGFVILMGLIYLAIKQRKILILIVSLILMNLIPTLMYLETNDFYLTSMVIFFAIFYAYGFYAVKEWISLFYEKYIKRFIENCKRNKIIVPGNNPGKDISPGRSGNKKITARILILFIFFLIISIPAANIFASNFNSMDVSKGTYMHDYWYNLLNGMKSNSILVSNSLTSHVPLYIVEFEIKKNIKIVRNVNLDDLKNIIKENIGKNDVYFTDIYLPDLSKYYDVELAGPRFCQKGFKESFLVYKVTGINADLEIEPENDIINLNYGEGAKIIYRIKNLGKKTININSMELELSKIIKFFDIDSSGDMKVFPAMLKGIYMWTNGPYIIEPGGQFDLIFLIKANSKGEGEITFRVTTGNMYVDGHPVKVIIN
ncbi:MAG: hypothetical protein M1326_03430, partial [Cyanobacteria bacterium]|nr:hypothetical protein [Cyanobacteriota bacterium]